MKVPAVCCIKCSQNSMLGFRVTVNSKLSDGNYNSVQGTMTNKCMLRQAVAHNVHLHMTQLQFGTSILPSANPGNCTACPVTATAPCAGIWDSTSGTHRVCGARFQLSRLLPAWHPRSTSHCLRVTQTASAAHHSTPRPHPGTMQPLSTVSTNILASSLLSETVWKHVPLMMQCGCMCIMVDKGTRQATAACKVQACLPKSCIRADNVQLPARCRRVTHVWLA